MIASAVVVVLFILFAPLAIELGAYALVPRFLARFAYLPLAERTVTLPQADLGRNATSRGYRASAASPLALAVLGPEFRAKSDEAAIEIDAVRGVGALRLVDANAVNRILAVARVEVAARDADIGMRITFLPIPFFSPFASLILLALFASFFSQLTHRRIDYALLVGALALTVVLAVRVGAGAKQRLLPAARWAMDEIERALLAGRELQTARLAASDEEP